jgi:hypothetical protein
MPAALLKAHLHVPRCSSGGLHWSSAHLSSHFNQFIKRRPLKSFLRLRKGQHCATSARRGCRDGQQCQAVSRAGVSATADLHTDERKHSPETIDGLDMSGNIMGANDNFNLSHIRAESSNGAGPSGRSPAPVTDTDRLVGMRELSNGAASSRNSQAATGGAALLDALDPASASSARDRSQRDLDRQRITAALDPALLSRKEVLRQLRTGEMEGLSNHERNRRLRISKINKGKVPWNAGRKHSPGADTCLLNQEVLNFTPLCNAVILVSPWLLLWCVAACDLAEVAHPHWCCGLERLRSTTFTDTLLLLGLQRL